MLVFTRKANDSIFLELDPAVDASTPVGNIFSQPIQIKIDKIRSTNVVLSCKGPKEIKILRGELVD